MNSRERVRKALNHETPDRIPFDLGSRSSAIEIEAYNELKKHLGFDGESSTFIRSHAIMEENILDALHVDTRWIHGIPSSCWQGADRDLYVDMWNVPWRRKEKHIYYELEQTPFKNLSQSEILNRKWPEIVSDDMVLALRAEAMSLFSETGYSISCDTIGAGIFERAWYLRGLENFVIDLMTEESYSMKYLRKILETQLHGYEKILSNISQYIDTVIITDDIATQDSMIVSPDIYRKFIKPLQKELFSYIKSHGVQVILHSCGAVYDLIPDFIEIGVEIIHPIQVSAKNMKTDDLKKEYGKDIVFWGGGCAIETLQFGTETEINEEVKKRILDLSAEGGFVFTPTHCIQAGTPPENILAMANALQEHGSYT